MLLLLFLACIDCINSKRISNNAAFEPLITPHFFQSMNPHMHRALSAKLIAESIPIPSQKIHFPFIGDVSFNVTSFRISLLDWHPSSGLFFRNNSLEYWAKFDTKMNIDYVTNSFWIMPSGTTLINLQGATFDVLLKFGFDKHKEILTADFGQIDIDVSHLKIHTPRAWINRITSIFKDLVKKNAIDVIKDSIKKTLSELLAEVSKVEFMTPNGPYHTEFTREPLITEKGLLLDLGIFKGVDLHDNASSFSSISKRSNGPSFIRPSPAYDADIQPLITKSFLDDLKPMVFQAIHREMITFDLISNHSISVPFSKPLELNITNFNVDQNSITWSPLTDINFFDGAINVNIGISFNALAEYQTNSKFFLPNSSLIAQIKNFQVITDIGLELVNSSLVPDFKTLNITMQKLEIMSSSISINMISSVLNGIIKSGAAALITSKIKNMVPKTIFQLLKTEMEIPDFGKFQTKFLAQPLIRKEGILFEMEFERLL